MKEKAKASLKEYTVETLEIAYYNFLRTIEGIKPETVSKQVNPNINPVIWIIGHVAAHMDQKFVAECLGEAFMGQWSWKEGSPFTIGQTKEIIQQGLPLTFKELVEDFLKVGEITFSYLRGLPEKKFGYLPATTTPTVNRIQRITLHIMGHMGQIRIIRKILNDPAPGFFVTGMTAPARNHIMKRFNAWWQKVQNTFP
ncbi:MAG: DinB family protein [Promethearchaeota archaeon]